MKSDKRYIPIESCLFNAFANSDFHNPQDERQMWAIEECFSRSKVLPYEYENTKAKKKHECVRGCIIKPGDQYFKRTQMYSSTKICVGCMAMILYYGRFYQLKPFFWDAWDQEKNQPTLLGEESRARELARKMDDISISDKDD